jgi:hypothetical protein
VSVDPDTRRLLGWVLAFVVLCVILGGLWPWLIR